MANARGIKILLSSKSTNTNRIIPNKVTVDLKKKGIFLLHKLGYRPEDNSII
jgi:hypothetical protein